MLIYLILFNSIGMGIFFSNFMNLQYFLILRQSYTIPISNLPRTEMYNRYIQ
jgi:hypothetical protein